MKQLLLLAAFIGAVAMSTFGQDDAEYRTWMKTIGATSGSLRKNLDAKNAEEASADAKKLEKAFAKVHVYWQANNV